MLEFAIPIALVTALALTAAWIFRANFLTFRENRNGDWHPWYDGKMRRRSNGRWEFREMTAAESKDDGSSAAW